MLKSMDTLVALCKNRGYIYPGSEIYGGLANTWDYGPLGNELKNNVKMAWRKKFIQESKYNVGLDAAILMNPTTWVASGHVGGFSDPLIDCKECKTRHRADKLIEEWAHENGKDMIADGMSDQELIDFINENKIPCPNCGKTNFTDIRKFNYSPYMYRIAFVLLSYGISRFEQKFVKFISCQNPDYIQSIEMVKFCCIFYFFYHNQIISQYDTFLKNN